ncbi:MAG: NAD-dependent epimerase/dehydratase family protein [Candidatus Dormibacteraeota bacterium]|nr:NAD-dependent epimerase/dehydratase family protein [Candidatus Dormibacteraeota bacterium]
MRALVLGGPGFVGTATCKELMRRGVETIAASRRPHPYGTFTSHVAFDRTDEAELGRVLGEVKPDVLLDLAAYQPSHVEAVIRHFKGRRYVFTSTGVYPDLFEDRPAREEDFQPLAGDPPAEPIEYREGKRWCETVLARSSGFPWTVIRPPAVLGAGDHTLRIAAYLQRVEDGGPLLVPAESYLRQAGLAWVRDVGYAHALAADLRKQTDGKAYNIAFEGVSLAGLIEAIGRAWAKPVRMVPVPYAELPPGASPYGPDPNRSAGYDLTRSRAELGFEPSALEDCLAEILAWYQAEHPSDPGYSGRSRELELAG